MQKHISKDAPLLREDGGVCARDAEDKTNKCHRICQNKSGRRSGEVDVIVIGDS